MLVAGVDEAGRGPLAGPVVAAAVVAGENDFPKKIPDSKGLSPAARWELYREVLSKARDVGVCALPPFLIDRINIRRAALLAMRNAVEALGIMPDVVLVDGRDEIPRLGVPQRAIVRGDATVSIIAAASIVAKVARDALMCAYARCFPDFGFERHKGYPTPQHRAALMTLGATILHRRSFKMPGMELSF